MVTAYGEEERRRRASELGAAHFITKPVDFDFLKVDLRRTIHARWFSRLGRALMSEIGTIRPRRHPLRPISLLK